MDDKVLVRLGHGYYNGGDNAIAKCLPNHRCAH